MLVEDTYPNLSRCECETSVVHIKSKHKSTTTEAHLAAFLWRPTPLSQLCLQPAITALQTRWPLARVPTKAENAFIFT